MLCLFASLLLSRGGHTCRVMCLARPSVRPSVCLSVRASASYKLLACNLAVIPLLRE